MADVVRSWSEYRDWGWNLKDGMSVPVSTDMQPVPEDMLSVIACKCKTTEQKPMQLTDVVNMACMLLHANTVVAKNVRMSVSIQTREASDGDESSFDDDDGMELDEDDGIVNDA